MYISLEYIQLALDQLKSLHPFYGITFLVCKLNHLPVGQMQSFSIDEQEQAFLRKYFHPNRNSEYFYWVFLNQKGLIQRRWVDLIWFKLTLFSIRGDGRTSIPKAFLQEHYFSYCGWSTNYVQMLSKHLKRKKIPIFSLAVWLYRERDFPVDTTPQTIINLFVQEFHLTSEEQEKLCDMSVPEALDTPFLRENSITWEELRKVIGSPPDDDTPDEGGALGYLELVEIGPARNLTIEPADRLNLLTGDNGLGKSFLLDCAWWALTGEWAGQPAYPKTEAKDPKIIFKIATSANDSGEGTVVAYDWSATGENKWTAPKPPVVPGLSLYVRVDGSFAMFDPARPIRSKTSVFSKGDVRDGRGTEINGLIQDWVNWQFSPDQHAFQMLTEVLRRLSPPEVGDLGTLRPGKPIRIAGDSRNIPTVEHPYGTIPVLYTSAGVQRIITLAYLLVWIWQEHQINSKAIRKAPEHKLVVLIDELESHLHPQWQRSILPALLSVTNALSSELTTQLFIATHSPIVVASTEPHFNPEKDKLFHLDLVGTNRSGKEAAIREVDFVRYGRIGSWLTSDVFDLRQDYGSVEAEQVIEEARSLQQSETPDQEKIKEVSHKLGRYLSDLDTFWPRWVKFAEKHGVEL